MSVWRELKPGRAEFACVFCGEMLELADGQQNVPVHRYRVPILSSHRKQCDSVPRLVELRCPASDAVVEWEEIP